RAGALVASAACRTAGPRTCALNRADRRVIQGDLTRVRYEQQHAAVKRLDAAGQPGTRDEVHLHAAALAAKPVQEGELFVFGTTVGTRAVYSVLRHVLILYGWAAERSRRPGNRRTDFPKTRGTGGLAAFTPAPGRRWARRPRDPT